MIYSIPTSSEVKIIDFGCATYEHEKHSGIINTRQYRAPEVILGGKDWDYKSDIWCVACILIEIYSGNLLFPTKSTLDHIAMIEKIIGPLPEHMIKLSTCTEIIDVVEIEVLQHKKSKTHSKAKNSKVKVVKINKLKIRNYSNVEGLRSLDDIIKEPKHAIFKDFLRYLLQIDPALRPCSSQILNHEFFRTSFQDSLSTANKLINK